MFPSSDNDLQSFCGLLVANYLTDERRPILFNLQELVASTAPAANSSGAAFTTISQFSEVATAHPREFIGLDLASSLLELATAARPHPWLLRGLLGFKKASLSYVHSACVLIIFLQTLVEVSPLKAA